MVRTYAKNRTQCAACAAVQGDGPNVCEKPSKICQSDGDGETCENWLDRGQAGLCSGSFMKECLPGSLVSIELV